MADSKTDLRIVNVMSLNGGEPEEATTSKINDEDKPLLKLIKQLVNFADNNSKTVLTNTELKVILAQEFDLDIWNATVLVEDIYMAVLKRFLKSWPRWDIIDQAVSNSKTDPSINIEEKLFEEYQSLKTYLKSMLDQSKEPAQAASEKLNKNKTCKNEGVLEILCSRRQLNKIFFQFPHPGHEDTIFNVGDDNNASKISVKNITFQDIVNWPGINISINYSLFLEYKRKNCNELQHTLVNKKLRLPREIPKIPAQIFCQPNNKLKPQASNHRNSYTINKNRAIEILENALHKLKTILQTESVDTLRVLINVMLDDISKLDSINRYTEYKYYLNKYPYVRHLSTPLEDQGKTDMSEKFDLELEEYFMPSVVFNMSKLQPLNDHVAILCKESVSNWLKIECTYCDQKYENLSTIQMLVQHFLEVHCDEPDWACSNCGESFTQQFLAGNKWKHICVKKMAT